MMGSCSVKIKYKTFKIFTDWLVATESKWSKKWNIQFFYIKIIGRNDLKAVKKNTRANEAKNKMKYSVLSYKNNRKKWSQKQLKKYEILWYKPRKNVFIHWNLHFK